MNIVLTITAADNTDLTAAVQAGELVVHSERGNGTFRRRHFLTAGSTARAEAEWVRAQREGQEQDEAEGIEAIAPRTMASIAKELHTSVSAVRRILVDLALTEELEDMDAEELADLLKGGEEVTVELTEATDSE